MKRINSYVGSLTCDVVHLARFQTKHGFDPEKLSEEIKTRVKVDGGDYRRTDMVIQRANRGINCYVMTFAYLDVLDGILALIEEIERDVTDAQRVTHLLGLVESE